MERENGIFYSWRREQLIFILGEMEKLESLCCLDEGINISLLGTHCLEIMSMVCTFLCFNVMCFHVPQLS